jgi:large subunit ribosomal protein L17
MRHSVFGRKLSRTTDERKRLFTGLVRNLLVCDKIVTSIAKAKAIQPIVEKLITKAKTGTDVNRRYIMGVLGDRSLTVRLIEETKTRFAPRTSGYTRIIKLGKRMGDATDTVLLSFVDERVTADVIAPKTQKEAPAKKEKVEKQVKTKKTVPKKSTKKTAKKA